MQYRILSLGYIYNNIMKKIAIIGATGNVGRIVTQKLKDKANLTLFASKDYPEINVHQLTSDKMKGFDIYVFNTESDISSQNIPYALGTGAFVVDSSSHYRLDPDVPLIVGPVNAHLIQKEKKLYAHANCLASPIALALNALKQFEIQSVLASTYQSTSGAGKKAMDECFNETKSIVNKTPYKREVFKRQIAFNVIPQVSDIMEDGFTKEEEKIAKETQKILEAVFNITATAVRVPVLIGHSISLSIQFKNTPSMSDVEKAYENIDGIQFLRHNYRTPIEIENSDTLFIGRARINEMGLHLWLCSDNLHRGAATDTVEIVERIMEL
jgi:aspartate-semialdehyde dehydrogenase